MKTFVNCRMMVGLSYFLILLATNGVTAGVNGLENARRSNLRRSEQHPQAGNNLRFAADTTNHRSLDKSGKDETEELESIEKEFSGEDEDNKSSEKDEETEELKKIEEEFDGGNKKDEAETSKEKESTTEAEETETTKSKNEKEEKSEAKPEKKEEAKEKKETPPPTAEPTEAPEPPKTDAPTMKPTAKPYTKNDDGFDPIKAEDEKLAEEEEVQELETELKQEEKVARRAGGLGIFFGILAMIFTAHQMSENPDGIYASVCRLAITISSVVVKIVCMPCRKVLGVGGGGNPYSGHMPISTSDYSYRNDPYRSNANAGFEMS